MKQPTDKEMLDWMERNSNKLLVKVENDQCVMFGYRDKVLPPSSEFNFPQWHYTEPIYTLREAITQAMKESK